jgi:hypothetical protein
MAEAFTEKSDKHDPQSERFVSLQDRVWPYINSDRGGPVITAASIFAKAREHGYNESLSMFEDISASTPEPNNNVLPFTKPGAAVQGKQPKLKRGMIHVADIVLPDTWYDNYIVKHWFGRGVDVQLFGQTGVGKTFILLDMGARIAAGLPWFGHRVSQTPVLLLMYEGITKLPLRFAALKKAHPEWPWATMPFAAQPITAPLLNQHGVDQMKEAIIKFEDKYQVRVGLLGIDTYARALGESTSDEDAVIKFDEVLDSLCETRPALTTLRVHHPGHTNQERARGSYAIDAAVDVNMRVEDGAIHGPKQRDDASDQCLGFALEKTELGRDQDNEEISSCIVVPAELPVSGSKTDEPKSPVLMWIVRKANDLLTLGEQDSVSLDDLVAAVLPNLPGPGENADGTAKRDRRGEVIKQGASRLHSAGRYISLKDDRVSLLGSGKSEMFEQAAEGLSGLV